MLRKPVDIRPRDLGMALTKLRRQMRDGLANDRQLVNHGAANQAVPKKRPRALSVSELRDGIGGREDVFEKEPLTPHR